MLRNFIFIALLFSTFSCKKAEDRACAKSVGDYVTEERSLAPFSALQLFDGIHYQLVQDSLSKVVIHCGENLINFIETDVENETLTITDQNKCVWLRELPVDIRVEIHYSTLDYVYNESHGLTETIGTHVGEELTWENWHVSGKTKLTTELEECTLRISAGASELDIDGAVQSLWATQSGQGRILAQKVTPTYCWADNKGTADMRINIAQDGQLDYIIDSFGNIIYSGEPSTIQEIDMNGSGVLIAD